MPDKAVYLLVVEGYADWEPAHAVAELRRNGNYRVESVGLTREPVASMGGIGYCRRRSSVRSMRPMWRCSSFPAAIDGKTHR